MKLLLLIIFIGAFGFLVISSLLRGIFSFLFGRPTSTAGARPGRQQQNGATYNQPTQTQKKFSKNEGEYVPYEEIKD